MNTEQWNIVNTLAQLVRQLGAVEHTSAYYARFNNSSPGIVLQNALNNTQAMLDAEYANACNKKEAPQDNTAGVIDNTGPAEEVNDPFLSPDTKGHAI